MRRFFTQLLATLFVGFLSTSAIAQAKPFVFQVPAKFPSGLGWQTMGLVGFNFNYPGYEGTPAERELAWGIWGQTIQNFPGGSIDDDNKWPAFIILTGFESDTHRYVFSSMSAAAAAYPACEDAINSRNPETPIYTNCPLRITIQNKKTRETLHKDVLPFCHIASNDSDQPKSRNYEQVAVSPDGGTAYFRVVQYGKPAPECNRSIRLK